MVPTQYFCLMLQYTFLCKLQTWVGKPFLVLTYGKEDIEDLKNTVKKTRRKDLAHVSATMLSVWKTKGEMLITKSTSKRLAETLGGINV